MNSFDRAGEALLLRFDGQRQIALFIADLARRLYATLRGRRAGG